MMGNDLSFSVFSRNSRSLTFSSPDNLCIATTLPSLEQHSWTTTILWSCVKTAATLCQAVKRFSPRLAVSSYHNELFTPPSFFASCSRVCKESKEREYSRCFRGLKTSEGLLRWSDLSPEASAGREQTGPQLSWLRPDWMISPLRLGQEAIYWTNSHKGIVADYPNG